MPPTGDKPHHELTSIRDTVESIWVAIVVALVLRAFLIEAFVIPTGSMAPGLMGEHWDLSCPACGYEYAFGLAPNREEIVARRITRRDRSEPHIPQGACCPNCGKPYNDAKQFVSGGDRVLVLKYLYHFAPPKPFDVVVFRNPQNNRENYIKRLIGLPGEKIEIVHGDVFVRAAPDAAPAIRRKPPVAQEAMWQPVFDNDYPTDPDKAPDVRSPRWVPSGDGWEADTYQRRFLYTPGPAPGELALQAEAADFLPHCGYNSAEGEEVVNSRLDVCTDLQLSVEFMPAEPNAAVALTLTSFDDEFRGEVVADGTVRLLHRKQGSPAGPWDSWGSAKLPAMKLRRGYQVALANADLSIRLSIDGRVALEVLDSYPQTYESLKALVTSDHDAPIPTPQARILAWGGPCELRHLRVMRDVYYTYQRLAPVPRGPLGEYALDLKRKGLLPAGDKPQGWGTTGHPITLAKHDADPDLDEFFVLGDNSPQSLDSRGWTWAAPTLRLYADAEGKVPLYQLGTVPRYNLIGKAFVVYWPAGFRPPGLAGLPIVPNFGKIRFVR